jgi:hypothetical protein
MVTVSKRLMVDQGNAMSRGLYQFGPLHCNDDFRFATGSRRTRTSSLDGGSRGVVGRFVRSNQAFRDNSSLQY